LGKKNAEWLRLSRRTSAVIIHLSLDKIFFRGRFITIEHCSVANIREM
jgi:hypothetical protein